MYRKLFLCLGFAPLLAVPACSLSKTADKAELQRVLESSLRMEKLMSVADASCPDNVKMKKGTTAECTFKQDGTEFRVKVTIQTDASIVSDKNKGGEVEFELIDAAVIDLLKAEEEITKNLESEGLKDSFVNCDGTGSKVFPVGGTFSCSFSAEGAKKKVVITVKDTDGNVDFKLEE
jgi:hypothetical protein